MSVSGKNGTFTTRIKRLFGYPETNTKRGNILFSSLLFSALLFFAYTTPFDKKQQHFPETMINSEAMLFVISPTTSKKQLKKIKSIFLREDIVLDYKKLSFSPFGLLDDVVLEVKMPDNSRSTFEVYDLKSLSISLDWNRESPLDIRPLGELVMSSICEHEQEKKMAQMPRPYTNTFDIPIYAGKVGFKNTGKNEEDLMMLDFTSGEIPLLFLNEKEISKTALVAKKLTARQVNSIRKLNMETVKNKYKREAPYGAYEIFADLNSVWGDTTIFPKEENANIKLHQFNILHKAEMRGLNAATPIGAAGSPITISSDNCEDGNKAFHVFNDEILPVPEGLCYPPGIFKLTEVDSFFILEEDLAIKRYGVAGNKGAYLYYLNHGKTDEEEVEKLPAVSSGIAESGLRESLSAPFDSIMVRNVQLEINSEEPAPLCFLNGKKMKVDQVGEWPAKILELAQFDSVMMISGESAWTHYGEEGMYDVWYIYDVPDAFKPDKVYNGAMLYIIDDEMILPNTPNLEQVVKAAIGDKRIRSSCYAYGTSATDLYGKTGENGVRTITTFEGESGKNGIRIIETEDRKTSVVATHFEVYPNPIQRQATIDFSLEESTNVKIMLFSSAGELVELISDKTRDSGPHSIKWRPLDLPNGIYHIQVRTEKESFTKSVLLQKGL